MRKVFLHGELGNSLGKEWSLEVDSVQEALWAIEANTSSLTDFFRKNSEKFGHYTFMIDGKDLDKHQLKSPIGDNEKSIHIMPQVAGGELGTIITAIVVSIVTGLIMQALLYVWRYSKCSGTRNSCSAWIWQAQSWFSGNFCCY